jgi:hypothetical protein
MHASEAVQTQDPATSSASITVAASVDCTSAVLDTLEQVAMHVYNEAAGGRIVAQAVKRVQRSTALHAAVERDDPLAVRLAVHGLIEAQIVRIRVVRGSRTLADVGKRGVLGPVTGVLRDAQGRTIGTFVLSVQGANGYVQTVHGLTGAQALIREGTRLLASTQAIAHGNRAARIPDRGTVLYNGVHYRTISFTARAFTAGKTVRITLLYPSPAPPTSCGTTAAQTVANTIGAVAMRIYQGEQSGAKTMAVVRHVERSEPFREAVANGDAAGARAAIIGFFRTHLHVVRVRATHGNRLVVDVGGPYALAPVAGTLRGAGGHVVGRFLLAIQDDMGYLLLAHNFTSAQVLLRNGASHQVMGTLSPGPASIPDRGQVVYRGVRYQAFSFTGRAFPSGPLRISLLVAAG